MNDVIPARRWAALGAIAALCLVMMVHVQSCTLLGLAAGTAADASHSGGGPAFLLDVKVGRPVTLVLWNGRTLEGRFAGWTHDSSAVDSTQVTGITHDSALVTTHLVSPRGAIVHLATEKGEVAIPAETIAKVKVSQYSGALTGMVAGMAIDVMVIRSMRDATDLHPTCSGPPPTIN